MPIDETKLQSKHVLTALLVKKLMAGGEGHESESTTRLRVVPIDKELTASTDHVKTGTCQSTEPGLVPHGLRPKGMQKDENQSRTQRRTRTRRRMRKEEREQEGRCEKKKESKKDVSS